MGKKILLLMGLAILSGQQVRAAIVLNVNTGNATADSLLNAEINKLFQVPDMTNFLTAMANAQAITNKGQGVSYATEHSLFVIGGGSGVGFSGGLSGYKVSSGLPAIGIGVQGSVMAGLSLSKLPVPTLGPIDLKRLTIFVNYFGISDDSLVQSLTIKANAFGLHLQYKLVDNRNLGGIGILNWGGLLFTTGIESSTNSLSYKVTQGVTVNSGGQTFNWTPSATSALTLEANSFSIPFELSTSVRVLYVVSVFAGLGVDLNFGRTTIDSTLNGPVTGYPVPLSGSAAASLTGSEEQKPTFGHLRFFAGPQFNLVPLKNTNLLSIYLQGNFSTGGNYGVHAGARIAW